MATHYRLTRAHRTKSSECGTGNVSLFLPCLVQLGGRCEVQEKPFMHPSIAGPPVIGHEKPYEGLSSAELCTVCGEAYDAKHPERSCPWRRE